MDGLFFHRIYTCGCFHSIECNVLANSGLTTRLVVCLVLEIPVSGGFKHRNIPDLIFGAKVTSIMVVG